MNPAEYLRSIGWAAWKRPPEGLWKCETCERYVSNHESTCPYPHEA